MKNLMRNLIAMLLFLSFQAAFAMECTVVKIFDGDTFECLTAQKRLMRVRMNEIDAPEKGQDFGRASRQHLAKLIFQKKVRLNNTSHDKYGRILATVFLGKTNVNLNMVQGGYAWAYRRYVKNDDYFKAERYARKHKMGLWKQSKCPIYPEHFRHGLPSSFSDHCRKPS